MTPEPDSAFAATCRQVCPAFRATGPRLRARKSIVLPGEVDGVAVVAKSVAKPVDVWRWYLAREIAIYQLRSGTLPMPRLVAADATLGILIVERVPGEPLGKRRDPRAVLPAAAIDELVAIHRRLAASTGAWPAIEPTPRVRSQLRSRLLEDPTAPIEWVRGGIERVVSRRIVAREHGRQMIAALDAYPDVAPGHGDLLLRNAIGEVVDERWRITLVDWECAGPHPADWDLALLYTQLVAESRVAIEREVRSSEARWRCFVALVAFAIAREISFAIAFRTPDEHPRLVRRRAELLALGAALAS